MKTLKYSLVAAIAATAFTNASAASLEEAIKNVEISGTVAYRYNDYEDGNTTNNYKVAVSLASKVNDDVTFNSRFIAGDNTGTAPASLNTTTDADQNLNVQLTEANFTYTGVNNLSVTVGKQGIATPFTVARDSMGGESTGTGILAAYNLAPVTLAGAYFNQTNIAGGIDLAAVAVIGSFGGINADAWYLDADNTYDIYTVGLGANYDVAGVSLSPSIRYTEQDFDANNNEASLFKVELGAAVGIFDAYVGYGKTGDDAGVAVDGNSSAMMLDPHWNVTLHNQADSDAIYANIGVQATDKLHVSLKYSDMDRPTGSNDEQETYAQVVYNMSANLSTYVRFGELKVDGSEDQTAGRLNVTYSF